MTGHTLATGRAATLIKLAFAAGAKLSAAFIAFGLTALVTRNMPNDEAGLFLLGFTILTVLSVFFRLGLDNVILRFLSAHGTDAFAQEKLNRGLLWVATAVIPSTALGMFFSDQIAFFVFNKPDFGSVLFWMLFALPLMTIFMLLAIAFQSQHRVVTTTIFQNLGISTLFVVSFSFLLIYKPNIISALVAARTYAGAGLVIFFSALFIWFGQSKVKFSLNGFKDNELYVSSMNLWVVAIVNLVVQWSGILISGAMLPSEDVAILTAAQRTAFLVSFILMVANMVVAPRYARMWNDGDMMGIQRLANLSTRGMTLMVLPLVLVMVWYSEKLMSFFGGGFDKGGSLLTIMVIGQFVSIAAGSAGYLLTMSAHEKDFRRVTLFVGPLTIFCAYFFIQWWGAVGAALVTAFGVGIQSLAAMFMVKRRLGFYPLV
jgi:O-antigen/teichoic acid export membrane protein